MVTTNTQSVCKHCHEKIFRAHGSWQTSEGFLTCMHNKSSFSAGHEPVSEPASTGEQPPTERFFRGDGVEEKVTYQPVTFEAARPSEPSAPQTSAEPRKQCGCVHGDSDQYCPDPLCPNYIAAYHVKPPCPQPVSGDAPGIKVTIYNPIAYLQELYADMGKRGECEICLKLQFCIEVLKEKLADPAPSPTPSVSTPGAFRDESCLSPVETHAMLAMEDKNMITTIIANEFSKQLRQQLTAEQMEEVIRLNAAERDKIGICHTHDFCDGNEIMLHALEALGIERISDALWNEAWSIAKGAGFTPAPSVAGTQPTQEEAVVKAVWMNSIHFYDHLEHDPRAKGLPVYKSEDICKADNPCIDTDGHCHALQVFISDVDPRAAQGTPQVEEIALRVTDRLYELYGQEWTEIDARESIRGVIATELAKHGVGAPAQPGPEEKSMTNMERDAARYWRLRVLGCAPCESKQLENGTVLRFNNLDEFVDRDIKIRPSRGEAELYERKVAAPAQGTPEPPKVDIRQKCVNFLCLRPDPKVDELAEFVESLLSPYFPPASQTPKWKCFHCEFETSDYTKAEAHFGDGEGDSTICLYWSKLSTEDRLQEFQDLVQQLNGERDEGAALLSRAKKAEKELATLATPASTARTDGWVSVGERLPADMEDVLIWDAEEAEGGFCAVAVGWVDSDGDWETETAIAPKITHWRELPAAPGSVPQAPKPINALKIEFGGHTLHVGREDVGLEPVPQAEPPK